MISVSYHLYSQDIGQGSQVLHLKVLSHFLLKLCCNFVFGARYFLVHICAQYDSVGTRSSRMDTCIHFKLVESSSYHKDVKFLF